MANMHDDLMYKGCDKLQESATNVWRIEASESDEAKSH